MPKVTSKGQVTIPKEIREAIGIGPGSAVEFSIQNGECVLKKVADKDPFAKWTGFLKKRKSTDQIVDELRGEVE